MIKKIFLMDTQNTYPYKNLAMEEYMTLHVPEDSCILFLWQNRQTVVIGRNQNCWSECHVTRLEQDGGYLVRRLSGGGAVFHDLGNLNFTFMVRRKDYDIDRQLLVVLNAVKLLGIDAEKSGRNDITADGRKFSGNAFYRHGDHCYHHGTLMLSADKETMARYLNVDNEKLNTKGVASVRSRVANLCEFNPGISVPQMKECLSTAFSTVYDLPLRNITEDDLPYDEIKLLTEKFGSARWKYGRNLPFEHEISRRFPWGDIRLQFQVNKGIIRDTEIYSDAMDQETIRRIGEDLRGCRYNADDMCRAISSPDTGVSADGPSIRADAASLIRDSV